MFDDDHYSVPVLFIKRFLLVYYSIGLLKDAFVDLRVLFNYYSIRFCPVFYEPSSNIRRRLCMFVFVLLYFTTERHFL
jgi:hypothetical protein